MNKKSLLSSFLLLVFIVSGFSFSTATQAASKQAAANASRAYNLYLGALRSKKTVKKVVKKKTVAKKVAKKTTTKKKVS